MCMARIGAVQKDEGADSDDACAISYLTDDTKQDIWKFPAFTSVTNWTKNFAGMLVEFTFMNLLIGASLSKPHTSGSSRAINHVQKNTEISD